MSQETERSRRIARQHLETTKLLGVDFVPINPDAGRDVASQAGVVFDEENRRVKIEALENLRVEHEASCPHCTTATGHTQIVFGEGNPDADVMFIGEAPGAEEDRTGRPFVGRAGQKLDDMITAMGIRREDVYIANILKSRPPDNRTPLAGEVAGCSPFLIEQIRIIEPSVIVTLGNPATKFILQTEIGITKTRGTWGLYQDGELSIDVMPTYHPAYLLRQYTRENRQRVWSDLKKVMDRIGLVT